jgi:hypothetical protein
MENLEWHPFYYNGLETNIEATKCGRIRRIQLDWMKRKINNLGEIDFSKIKLSNKGYKIITIKIEGNEKKTFCVHQIIAVIFLNHRINGNTFVIDHINSIKTDNRLENLKIVTNRENISKERLIKSGLPTGVHFRKKENYFQSKINIKGKHIHLGYFKDLNLASQAYQNALKNLKNG